MTLNEWIDELLHFRRLHGNVPVSLCGDGFNRGIPKLVFDARTAGAAIVASHIVLADPKPPKGFDDTQPKKSA